MKKISFFLIVVVCISYVLFYRSQNISCDVQDVGFQRVSVHHSFLIEQPELVFELSENAEYKMHYLTTDFYLPVLSIYNRDAVQAVSVAYFEDYQSFAVHTTIYEFDREYPIDFEGQWTLLEKTDKASLCYSENNRYIYYQILLPEKEIRVQFLINEYKGSLEDEIIECIMQNYQRLSQ